MIFSSPVNAPHPSNFASVSILSTPFVFPYPSSLPVHPSFVLLCLFSPFLLLLLLLQMMTASDCYWWLLLQRHDKFTGPHHCEDPLPSWDEMWLKVNDIRLNSAGDATQSYYLRNFLIALWTVFEEEEDRQLFDVEDLDTLYRFYNLSGVFKLLSLMSFLKYYLFTLRKVDAATRCSGTCSHTWPDLGGCSETQMRFVTCIVHERQLRLYGHVAHFPDADPAHKILLVNEPHEWGGQQANHVSRGCSRMIGVSMRWGWARHRLGDGQTEAPGVLAQSGHSNALLRHMLTYLTKPHSNCIYFIEEIGWKRTTSNNSYY